MTLGIDQKPLPAYPFMKASIFPFIAKVSLRNVSQDHTKRYHPLKSTVVAWLEKEIEKEVAEQIWEYDNFDDVYAYFSFVNENDALFFKMRWG